MILLPLAVWLLLAVSGTAIADGAAPVLTLTHGTESRELTLKQIEARRVRFIALDDYTTFLTPAQRREKRYLLVTRLYGEPVGEEALGPLKLVVPEDVVAAREGSVPMTRWIWAIEEISAS